VVKKIKLVAKQESLTIRKAKLLEKSENLLKREQLFQRRKPKRQISEKQKNLFIQLKLGS
jgi:hypothetical protein